MNRKKVYWYNDDVKYSGTAEYDEKDGIITIFGDDQGVSFDSCTQDDCADGITLGDVWSDIPEDITGWSMT